MDLTNSQVSKEEPNGNRYQTRGIRKTYVNDVDIGLESDQSDYTEKKVPEVAVDEDWNPVVFSDDNDNDIYSSDEYQPNSDSDESDFDEHFKLKQNKNASYNKIDDHFICSECCQFFQTEEDAERHVDEHRKGIMMICNVCEKKCKSDYTLAFHKLNNHTSVHRCSICSFQCESFRELNRHTKKCHKSPSGSRMCHMCGSLLQSEELWLLHCYEVHRIGEKPEPKYTCQVCGKKMYSKSTYYAHKRIHTEKVFKCQYKNCDYRTAFRGILKKHSQSVHLGIREYKCTYDDCDANFGSKLSRKDHMNMVHLKIRNIPCTWPECHKRFYADKHLKVHMKIHTGEKNLSCEHCDYRCIQKAALNWHLNKTHGIVNEKLVSKCVKVIKRGRKSKENKCLKIRTEDEEH